MPTKTQREYIFNLLGYDPTPEQQKIHDSLSRIKLVLGGERGGKSFSAGNEFTSRFFEGKLYWLVAADYSQCRAEYDYICENFDKLGWNYTATKHIDPGEILVDGGFRIVTKSAMNPRKLGMEAPNGIIVCECGQLTWEDFLRLRGRIAEKRAWMYMSGTLESSLGWYPEMFMRGQIHTDEFASFSLPSWSNTKVYPGGRYDPEILALENSCSAEWFSERYGGIPVPPKGLVFPEFKVNIHTGQGGDHEFDPSLPVYIWVDPGYAHYYAVEAIQQKGEDIYVVDEVYHKGLVTKEIITVCEDKPWWKNVKRGAIDVAALQHQAMPAVASVWASDAKIHLASQKIRIQDGIERFKTFLKVNPITNRPSIFINSRCQGLISELGGCPNPDDGQTRVYQWKTDREGNVIGDVPADKNCDAIKATIYGLIDLTGYGTAKRKIKVQFI